MSLSKRFLHPLLLARRWWSAVRFNRPEGYREDDYWETRHRRYRGDFRAVASYDWEREKRYPEQRRQFLEILANHDVGLGECDALEFGSGNGFWAGVLLEEGVRSYCGIDISRTAVEESARQFPRGHFLRHHLGTDPLTLERPHSLVFSIDVIQHVVERTKLLRFLRDMERVATPGSLVFCTSYLADQDGHPGDMTPGIAINFVVPWSLETIDAGFPESQRVAIESFWDKSMIVYRKQGRS